MATDFITSRENNVSISQPAKEYGISERTQAQQEMKLLLVELQNCEDDFYDDSDSAHPSAEDIRDRISQLRKKIKRIDALICG